MFLRTLLVTNRSIFCNIRNKIRITNKTASIQHYFLCFSILRVAKIVQKKRIKYIKKEGRKLFAENYCPNKKIQSVFRLIIRIN